MMKDALSPDRAPITGDGGDEPASSLADEVSSPTVPEAVPEESESRFALRSASFRRYIVGCFVSWSGDWMDLAALNWVTLMMTNSPLALGIINACRLLPVFVMGMPAGLLADHCDRRRLLMSLEFGTMLMTLALGGLLYMGTSFWLFAIVVTLRSTIASMAAPVRQSLLPDLVAPVAVPSAVATHAAVLNIARILGPASAGLLLAVVIPAQVFWINGASFLVVLWTVYHLTPRVEHRITQGGQTAAPTLREAIVYLRENPLIRSLITLSLVPLVLGFPYMTMLPLFARDLLEVGPAGFGTLLALAGAGALIGAVGLSVVSVQRAGRWLIGATLSFGLGLLCFALSEFFWLSACMIFLVGLSSQVFRTVGRITLQVEVPSHLRGRILSIVMMDRGLIPLGAILLGGVAEMAGAYWTGVVMGGGCIAATMLLLIARRQLWGLQLSQTAYKP